MHPGAFARANDGGRKQRVVADIVKLSVGREAYYTRELATDHEQYLSGLGKSPGRWCGAGATSLGLQGEASLVGFGRMSEGRDPDTWELLGRPPARPQHRAGLQRGPATDQERVGPLRGGVRGGCHDDVGYDNEACFAGLSGAT
jgi:hypothetical protein